MAHEEVGHFGKVLLRVAAVEIAHRMEQHINIAQRHEIFIESVADGFFISAKGSEVV